MSFFHRRARSASAHRPQQPASSSAHLAAAQAFNANRSSQPNLSASAAAAALRSMSPLPTPVNQVQTKRMLQRQTSNSSTGSATRGRGRDGLARQGSSGSMTERTFRSPSPGRPAAPQAVQPPPVPQVPANYQNIPPIPARSHRRSASMEAPPPRVTSPTFAQPRGRGQYVTNQGQQSAPRIAAARVVSLHTNLPSQDSQNSINFSRPRPLSPSPTSPTQQQFQRSVPNGISASETKAIQKQIVRAAEEPVKKKTKPASQGSHFQSTDVPFELDAQPPQKAQPAKTKSSKAAVSGEATHFPANPSPAPTESDSETTPEKNKRSQRASGALYKQPSVVREDWEGEQNFHDAVDSNVQTREQQGLSPVNSPQAISASKREVPEANVSRKMEDPVTPANNAASVTSFNHAVTMGAPDTATSQGSYLSTNNVHAARNTSLSPSRSTRFSNRLSSDLSTSRKHEPPPRSVSPAKSALKHYQSPPGMSPSDSNFARPRNSSVTPSEASDSNISVDGQVRRKKSARVSFETDTAVVGTAAETVTSDSPMVASPQNSEQYKKTWYGKNKPTLTTIPSDDHLVEGMPPRPELPSFGSVRGKGRRSDDEPESNVSSQSTNVYESGQAGRTSGATSESSSTSTLPKHGRSASSDHAIGGILAQDSQRQAGPMTEYNESNTLQPERRLKSVMYEGIPTAIAVSGTVTPVNGDSGPSSVPILALQPPTPGVESDKKNDQWIVDVPGGFPISEQSSPGIVPADDKKVQPVSSQRLPALTSGLYDINEDSDDNTSIYSDAAEDISDFEGDGYGSINALVTTPVSAITTKMTTPPESPSMATFPHRPQEPSRTTSWEEAQARWSGIAQQTRQGSFGPPSPPLPKVAAQQRHISSEKVNAQAATPTRQSQPQPSNKVVNQPAVYSIPPPKQAQSNKTGPGLRQTMKTAPAPAPVPQAEPRLKQSVRQPSAAQSGQGFKQSMRNQPVEEAGAGLRQSMRGSDATKLQPKTMRGQPPRMTQPVAQSGPQSAAQSAAGFPRTQPQASQSVQRPVRASKPVPPFKDDSDSESSFRKARRRKTSEEGRYTMRSSMRAGAQAAPAPRAAPQPTSPVRRAFSPIGDQRTMRTSLRGSTDSGPTLRQPSTERKSSGLFERAKRAAKSPTRNTASPPPRSTALPLTTKFRSNRADSDSDDDPPKQTNFRSRFEDSSDDEPEAAKFRPVRGIPRKANEGDSTDLEDSSDEEKKQRARKVRVQPPTRIEIPAANDPRIPDAPLSPNTMKKRGLFSRFKSKKDKDREGSQIGSPTPSGYAGSERPVSALDLDRPSAKSPGPNKAPESSALDTKGLGFNSAAERDALVEQTLAKLEAAKTRAPERQSSTTLQGIPEDELETPDTTPQRPGMGSRGNSSRLSSPRLQRRNTPQRMMSDQWPAVPPIPVDLEKRPYSSDAQNGRPTMNGRQETTSTVRTEGGTVVYGRSGKKKRFPMLRKAFGLVD